MSDRNLEMEWLKRRQHGIGSSNSPVLVLGEVYGKTPLDVYLAKKTDPEIITGNPDLRRGHTYEPLAAAMFEQQSGIRVFTPQTDDERYGLYQVWDPERDWLYADFDGFCEDGWALEVKSPRQRRCDRFRTEGATDYYQVQCHHLAHIANVADLPFLPDPSRWRGKVKGTRILIYEPENVDLIVIEIPYDQEVVDSIIAICGAFWTDHVLTDTPPFTPAPPKVAKKKVPKGKGGKYTPVDGGTWDDAGGAFFLAKQLENTAKRRRELAQNTLKEAMDESGLTHVITGSGLKFQYTEQDGRRTLDVKALKAANPHLDLEQYMKQGNTIKVFRAYGSIEQGEADSLGEGIIGIQEQLEAFAGRDLDTEAALEIFDQLRNEAELYDRLLEMEREGIRAALDAATVACAKKTGPR